MTGKGNDGKTRTVLICEFKDGFSQLIYTDAKGVMHDYCPPHYWSAIDAEVTAIRMDKLREARKKELGI